MVCGQAPLGAAAPRRVPRSPVLRRSLNQVMQGNPNRQIPSAEQRSTVLPEGVSPLEHLRGVVERERASWNARPPLLLTHKTPDPDALGALAGLDALLRTEFGLKPVIATSGRIFRAENVAMVNELGMDFMPLEGLQLADYCGIFLVDTQPGFGHTPLPEGLPIIGVFDHHQPPPEEVRASFNHAPHYDVRLGLGATSSMIYGYLREAGLTLDPATATALCCGVRFDTADLSMHVTALDTDAFYDCFRLADRPMLARINRPALPSSYYKELHRSLSRARNYGPLVFGLLGRVMNPESVAEMADFFRRMKHCKWALVGGAFEDNYYLSVRTELAFNDAYPLLEAVMDGEGSFGGRGPVAGGQIPLECGDEQSIKRLERRLRMRTLKLVDSAQLQGSDPKRGTRLTRLP